MTRKLVIPANDILKGEINPEKISARYIAIEDHGAFRRGNLDKLLEAVNHLAKYGWKAIGMGYTDYRKVCLMERPE